MHKDTVLHAEMVATTAAIDLDIMCDVLIKYETNNLILRLKRFVYTSDEKSIEVPFPDGVWQHIKQEYFPNWLLNKYPVHYKYITVKAKEVFPHLSYLAHNKARHLHLRIYEPLENVHCGT